MFKVIVQQIPFIYGVPHASKKDYKKDACIRPALFRTSNVFIPFSMSTLRDPAKKVLALAARPLRPYFPAPPRRPRGRTQPKRPPPRPERREPRRTTRGHRARHMRRARRERRNDKRAAPDTRCKPSLSRRNILTR